MIRVIREEKIAKVIDCKVIYIKNRVTFEQLISCYITHVKLLYVHKLF